MSAFKQRPQKTACVIAHDYNLDGMILNKLIDSVNITNI